MPTLESTVAMYGIGLRDEDSNIVLVPCDAMLQSQDDLINLHSLHMCGLSPGLHVFQLITQRVLTVQHVFMAQLRGRKVECKFMKYYTFLSTFLSKITTYPSVDYLCSITIFSRF